MHDCDESDVPPALGGAICSGFAGPSKDSTDTESSSSWALPSWHCALTCSSGFACGSAELVGSTSLALASVRAGRSSALCGVAGGHPSRASSAATITTTGASSSAAAAAEGLEARFAVLFTRLSQLGPATGLPSTDAKASEKSFSLLAVASCSAAESRPSSCSTAASSPTKTGGRGGDGCGLVSDIESKSSSEGGASFDSTALAGGAVLKLATASAWNSGALPAAAVALPCG
mmetsp:Transcript_67609/g.162311  ORF Transcript_67609/g.162311 Transcript_67609/m.162311 type:complete len:232 (-) Transcript_67609:167-862(-)